MTWNGLPLNQVQMGPNGPVNLGPANTAYTRLMANNPARSAGGGRGFVNPPLVSAAPAAAPASVPAASPWDTSLMNRYALPTQAPVQAAPSMAVPAAVAAPSVVPEMPQLGGGPSASSSMYNLAPDQGFNWGLQMPTDNGAAFAAAGATGASASPGLWDSFKNEWIGTSENPGMGGFALGAINAASNLFFGMKQYGLAKQTLAENKRQFQLNYDAQKKTTNSALEDRQRARVASNPGAYESVGSYMDKNGVK